MATYTIAQAKDQFSKIIDEALAGASVTITRHGKPVVRLVPEQPETKMIAPDEWDTLFASAQTRPLRGKLTGADIVRAMRDDEPE